MGCFIAILSNIPISPSFCLHQSKLLRMNHIVFFFFSLLLFSSSLVTYASDIQYIENKGQSPSQVSFEAALPGGKVYFENNQWVFNFLKYPEHQHNHPIVSHDHDEKEAINGHAYKMTFVGANATPVIRPFYPYETYHNYFLGNDPSKWASNVRLFEEVFYSDLYPSTDLKVYSNANGMKYDFIVKPGGNPNLIKISYEGVDDLYIDRKGNLMVKTSINEIKEVKPYAYQIINGKEKSVKCSYELKDCTLSFSLPKGYNKNAPLYIDPELVFSSYSGSSTDNWGYTATYDNDGHLYGGGIVFGAGYPTTIGSFQVPYGGGDCDIGITKFTPDGNQLIYSTYIGGTGSELPHSLVVNNQNQLVLMGTTSSLNYPTTPGCFDNTFNGGNYIGLSTNYLELNNGSDLVISLLNPNGNILMGSTYFGGSENDGINNTGNNDLEYNYGDHARGEVIIDDQDNIYIGTCTRSTNIPGSGTIQSSKKSKQDGIIAKFNSTVTQLQWYTYIGGNDEDAVYSLKVAPDGSLYACGGTQGSNFIQTTGINQTFRGGQADGFLVHISADGQNLLGSTFIGTSGYDQTYFVEIDALGDIYVVGQTEGNYPAIGNNIYVNNNAKQFIHKLTPDLNSTIWSTSFGSGDRINFSPTAFLVDICGRIYVSGWGGSANNDWNFDTGTTNGMPITADAYQSNTDGSDMYFFTLEKDASSLLYGSFFGAAGIVGGREHVDGGTSRFDKQGTIYQAVCAGCGGGDGFPTTPGAWSNDNGSNNCNLGVIKFNFEPNIIASDANAAPSVFGCAPYTVNFINQGSNAQEYFWDFGDGTTSDEENPTHVFGLIDTYTVKFRIVDSTSCNIADSTSFNVFILDSAETIIAGYSAIEPELCDPYIVEFTNLSFFEEDISTYIFEWDLGNGDLSNDFDLTYEYPVHGVYEVSLTVTGAPPCVVEDVFSTIIDIPENPIVFPDFNAPDFGCIPFPTVFEALDEAEFYLWDFGDGTTDFGQTVEHLFEDVGTYDVQLIAIDSTTCNISDSMTISLDVFESPQALFDYDQPEPYILVPIQFNNRSTPDNQIYSWDFGDGTTSNEEDPVHSYTLTGDIEVCLTVTNPESPCSDTHCETIFISDEFAIKVPTAFTPNGDGQNDSYGIFGFGFENFTLKIFNRWGEKVFETDDIKSKWDGTYNGKIQELGVFVYYIDAVVAGGIPYSDKGNITLVH